MSGNSMSFKAKINNYAKKNNIPPQVVLQNYMFERYLERLCVSKYSDKFIIKGGVLIASIVGLDTRSTMDLDVTLKNLPLTETDLITAIKEISLAAIDDSITFKFVSLTNIRKKDVYGGYRVRIDAVFENITTPLWIDVSVADVITPSPVEYVIESIFEDKKIKLNGYNIETILAEKVESILSLGILSTRPRDFYDVYILTKTKKYSKEIFKEALANTSKHRGSSENIKETEKIILLLENNQSLKTHWLKYQNTFDYAKNISFSETIEAIRNVLG